MEKKRKKGALSRKKKKKAVQRKNRIKKSDLSKSVLKEDAEQKVQQQAETFAMLMTASTEKRSYPNKVWAKPRRYQP